MKQLHGPGVLVTLLLLIACGGSVSDTPVDERANGVGGGPVADRSSSTPVPGEYVPPSASENARQRALIAEEEDAVKARFEGSIGGIRFVPLGDEGSADISPGCEAVQQVDSSHLKIAYLPPGSEPASSQQAGICSDGIITYVMQDFIYDYGFISIAVGFGEKAFVSQTSGDRVRINEIGGREFVVVDPVIPEGNGYSAVLFGLGRGFAAVQVTDLPIEETLKIAEGITCDACQ